jgi:hypothetical protein
VEVEERGAIQMKGIARDVKTYAVKGRKLPGEELIFSYDHPAGVSIDIDPTTLDANERAQLSDKLTTLAEALRRQ